MPLAALAAAFALIIILGWRSFGGALPMEANGYRVELPVPRALNMEVGADVTIAGVHVGDVVELRRDGYQPVAEINLEPSYAPLHEGAKAITRSKSLLGEAYIEITRGDLDAPKIEEGTRLPLSTTEPAQSIDDFLETFSPDARADLKRLARGMARGLNGRGTELNEALGTAEPFTASLHDVMRDLDDQRAQIPVLINETAAVFGAFAEREAPLQEAVRSGQRVLTTTADNDDALRETVRALPPFLEALRRVSGQLRATSPDLLAATESLEPVAPLVEPALVDLAGTSPLLETAFRRLRPVLDAGGKGLPAAESTLKVFGESSKPVYTGLRDLIPTVQLASEVHPSLVSFFANVAQWSNGQIEEAPGERASVLSAMPSFWNESIGGWVKRLPSNRPNPYPRPNGALSIGSGTLNAFDCRQTGNTEYVPPTGGNGAPPCIEQGPWEFNGESAYYPRLKRAAP